MHVILRALSYLIQSYQSIKQRAFMMPLCACGFMINYVVDAKMWDDIEDDEEDSDIGKYLGWLLGKGYADRTARSYNSEMRFAEQENLTIESVNDIYESSSQGKRTRLRHAVRMLDEYYSE